MKLEAKGESPYTEFQHNPAVRAQAESNVVLSAYRLALDTVLTQVSSKSASSSAQNAQMSNYVALRKLSEEIRNDLDHCDLVLDVIAAKLMIVRNDESERTP